MGKRRLDPDAQRTFLSPPGNPPVMNDLLESAAARAIRYLQELPDRRVAPAPEAVAALERFEEALPESPDKAERVIALLDEAGSPATMASAGPRFFGFVIGGSHPVAVAANWLATAWDQNAGAATATPVAARLEQVAGRWLVELFGLPQGTAVGFVTGATMANTTALAAARHAVLAKAGWDVEPRGLLRCARGHRRRGQRGAPDAAQSARPARVRPRARRAGAGGRAGPHAGRRPARRSRGPPSCACRPAT